MSLNQITQDVRKPWLDGRFENLTVDGILNGDVGEVYTGTIQWSGPFTPSVSRAYTATVINRNVILVLNQLLETATSTSNINGNPDATFDANLLPTGLTSAVEGRIIVVNNGSDVGGRFFLQPTGQILIEREYNRINSDFVISPSPPAVDPVEQLYNYLESPANNSIRFTSFSTGGICGWNRPVVIVYNLDQ